MVPPNFAGAETLGIETSGRFILEGRSLRRHDPAGRNRLNCWFCRWFAYPLESGERPAL